MGKKYGCAMYRQQLLFKSEEEGFLKLCYSKSSLNLKLQKSQPSDREGTVWTTSTLNSGSASLIEETLRLQFMTLCSHFHLWLQN